MATPSPTTAAHRRRLRQFLDIDLYPVTCERLSHGRSDFDVLDAVAAAGARIIQLRDKDSSVRALFEKAGEFRRRTRAAGMLLIINDHVDIALAVDADGVHLGQDDLPIAAARALLPDTLIGASTHNRAEAAAAVADGADYINVGPIFPTGTKAGLQRFLGPGMIRQMTGDRPTPFTVMGGINHENLQAVLDAGATRVAVVTAVTAAADMRAAARALRTRILDARAARR